MTTKREHLTHIHILHDFFFTPFVQLAGCAQAVRREHKDRQAERASTKRVLPRRAFHRTAPSAVHTTGHQNKAEQSGREAEQRWNKSWNKATAGDMKTGVFHGTCGAPCDEPFCDLLRSDGPRPEARPTWGAGGERSPPLHGSQQWNRHIDARCLRQWYMTTVLQHLVDSNVFCRDAVLNSRANTSPTCAFIKRARSTSCSSLLTSHSCASHSKEKMGA